VRRCRVAHSAQGRHPVAAPAFLVREHRPAVCRQGRRHHRPVSGATAQRLGGVRRQEALDPGLATQDGLRFYQQRYCKLVRGLKSTYKRHGTINLFAALNVATGTIQSKTTATKKRPDFQAFLDEVVSEVPRQHHIHVILDNYSTHKKNDEWLAQHPNVHFHFTPTSASWLNQVEIWFGILSRKTLRGASFTSTEDLTAAIKAFIAAYN